MSTPGIILFEYGTEGGEAIVYKLSSNEVIEKGSSGGILDDEDDPIRSWERKCGSWDTWWHNFTNKHTFWILFRPIFIHEDIKGSIRVAVENFQVSEETPAFHKEHWLRKLKNGS